MIRFFEFSIFTKVYSGKRGEIEGSDLLAFSIYKQASWNWENNYTIPGYASPMQL